MKKYIGLLTMMVLLVCSLCACGSKNTSADASYYMGTITAIDGNTITASVTESRFGGGKRPEGGERPEGFDPEKMPSEMPEGFEPEKMPSEMPEGFDPEKMPSEMPEGFNPENMPEGIEKGERPEGFDPSTMFEGEEMVIEVDKKISIYVNEEKASVSDLNVGDFVQITVANNQVTEIRAGIPEQGAGRPQGDAPQGAGAQQEEVSQ